MHDRKNAILPPNKRIYLSRLRQGALIPNEVPEEHFWLLIDVSSIHSEKVILALKDFLVAGDDRKDVCERYGVNNGYFSTSLNRLNRVSQLASKMADYYLNIK
ncbi:TPA: transcriptional regulator [Escherichia coli]|nr:transcriptional regulator [Escherichia coli]HAZ3680327.1 transcriptional regulator [Escherichia coli]HBA7074212.1 transcriptional regulator [Escherichia coli]HBA7189004.1 transcriptional regulator [Escherichia coli]HBA8276250.1 transcriptional regulator [Escherichia coli]